MDRVRKDQIFADSMKIERVSYVMWSSQSSPNLRGAHQNSTKSTWGSQNLTHSIWDRKKASPIYMGPLKLNHLCGTHQNSPHPTWDPPKLK